MSGISKRALKIVSGGQTGVDRAALDFAIQRGVPHGGWCPRDRRAEDGALPADYDMQETPSRNYKQRTRWNVRDSDATVLFTMQRELSGGTKLTAEIAERLGKPLLQLSGDDQTALEAAKHLQLFVAEHNVTILNVAGPRASQEPATGEFVVAVLQNAFAG